MTDTRLVYLASFLWQFLKGISAADNGSMYISRYCEQFMAKTLIASDVTSSIHCGLLCEMENCPKYQYDSKDAKCYKGAATVATSTNYGGMMVNKLSISSCQPNYDLLPFTNICIRLSADKRKWHEADSECKTQGANLVSIPCSYVLNALYEYITSKGITDEPIWLGFNDQTTEGKFEWSNGQPVTYTNWVPNQPNNIAGKQHWVALGPGSSKWNDRTDFVQFYYVCSTFI